MVLNRTVISSRLTALTYYNGPKLTILRCQRQRRIRASCLVKIEQLNSAILLSTRRWRKLQRKIEAEIIWMKMFRKKNLIDMSKYVDYTYPGIPWVRFTIFRLYTMHGSRGLHFTVANSFSNFILREILWHTKIIVQLQTDQLMSGQSSRTLRS
jgi:hypothetical protein